MKGFVSIVCLVYSILAGNINLSEIVDITDTEFNELLEDVDLGELDIRLMQRWTGHVGGAVGHCLSSCG